MIEPGAFYDSIHKTDQYAPFTSPAAHFATDELRRFIIRFGLKNSRCLEIGSGRGAFQDLVEDYTGLDMSKSVSGYYHKPFFAGDAASLPFESDSFDAVWSVTVLEHVRKPEKALKEMRRVLKPGGLLYLHPAWHCRPWVCEGIPVRSYEDLSWRQRWIKFTLPIRDTLLVRGVLALPQRFWKILAFKFTRKPIALKYKSLNADYSTFWMVDSDACCALDQLDVIQWFESRGDEVISHPTMLKAFLSRSEAVIVRIGAD